MTVKYDHKAIGRIREERKMSVQDLAYLAKLSQPSVYAYEKGQMTPSATRLAKIASVLDTPIQEFFRAA